MKDYLNMTIIIFFILFNRTCTTCMFIHVTFAAPLGSLIGNRLSCRISVILGGFLASIGLVLSSFATSLEYLYLTLGVVTGKSPKIPKTLGLLVIFGTY